MGAVLSTGLSFSDTYLICFKEVPKSSAFHNVDMTTFTPSLSWLSLVSSSLPLLEQPGYGKILSANQWSGEMEL